MATWQHRAPLELSQVVFGGQTRPRRFADRVHCQRFASCYIVRPPNGTVDFLWNAVHRIRSVNVSVSRGLSRPDAVAAAAAAERTRARERTATPCCVSRN